MHPHQLNVEEGITAICQLLPKLNDVKTRNSFLEIAYKLVTRQITSTALNIFNDEGRAVLMVIGDTAEEQIKVIDAYKKMLADQYPEALEPREAVILQFPVKKKGA